MSSPELLAEYPRVRVVGGFHELATAVFGDGVNAFCWPRELPGNFQEVVERLEAARGITTIPNDRLEALLPELSPDGQLAVQIMLDDLRRLRELQLEPVLDCINGYVPRSSEPPGPVRTDVCSWHADSATGEADTWLCTYHGPSSEGLLNEEAVCRVNIPETRAALLRCFGGEEGEAFQEYLEDHFYTLHYAALAGARPYPFGFGNLWRIATEYPGCPVPPCIHRAPDPVPGQLPRLLLLS